MASYFNLILDTNKPILSLYAPPWAVQDDYIEFSVASSEDLDLGYVHATIKDSDNVIHELAMSWDVDLQRFVGGRDAYGLAKGIATISVKLRDEVYNSATITTTFKVVPQASMKIKINSKNRSNVRLDSRKASILVASKEIPIDIRIYKEG